MGILNLMLCFIILNQWWCSSSRIQSYWSPDAEWKSSSGQKEKAARHIWPSF